MSASDIENLANRLKVELESPDTDVRAEFQSHFAKESAELVEHMSRAFNAWHEFFATVADDDERRQAVAALLFSTLTLQVDSYKLFISGHTVAAGGLYRQVLEGVAMTLLCSVKGLAVLDQFLVDRYDASTAVTHLRKQLMRVGVRRDAYKVLASSHSFTHRYAHLGKMTVATHIDLSAGGRPHVGALFDAGKLREYGLEVKGRVSLARVLPELIAGVRANVAKW